MGADCTDYLTHRIDAEKHQIAASVEIFGKGVHNDRNVAAKIELALQTQT